MTHAPVSCCVAAIIVVAIALPATARAPLRDVAEIDNTLMVIGIADEIRRRCDGIDARLLRAVRTLSALRSRARDLGYTAEEIEAYVSSDGEKARMRAKAEAWLAAQGVDADDTAQLCAFGAVQIDSEGVIGRLLR